MIEFYRENLLLISRVLLSRLTRPNTLEANIIQNHLLDQSSEPYINLEKTLGRFVGCFLDCDDSVCFYLAARTAPDDKITHVFVYYLNLNLNSVRKEDLETLMKYIPELKKPNNSIKIGLVNVNCISSSYHYLSLFLEAIDFSLSSDLINHFKTKHIIEVEFKNSLVNPLAIEHSNKCIGVISQSSLEEFKSVASNFALQFELSRAGQILDNPDIALVEFRGHFIGIIFHKESRAVNYIVVHKDQLEDRESYDSFNNLVDSFYDVNIVSHPITRLHFKDITGCDSKLFRYGLNLALHFMPHIFVGLKTIEMINVCENCSVEPISTIKSCSSTQNRSLNLSVSAYSQSRANYFTRLIVHNDGRSPENLYNIVDRESTFPRSDFKAEISFWREISKERQHIRDLLVPPVHKMEPYNDLTQSYLSFMPCYCEAINFMAKLWSQYAKTVVMDFHREILNMPSETRFIIHPSKTLDTEEDFLILIDTLDDEWIYLQPSNVHHKNSILFEAITRRFRLKTFPVYSHFIGRAVPITNGDCHDSYPKLHLLMSLYVIFRLFRYGIKLPQKIIFGEWELRKYASNICTQLQVANSEYNIRNNMIDRNGYLTEEAMQSLPSPLTIETGVVPKDQCMFCKRRGFNNLGRHMSMAHGGQAQFASSSRR